MCVENKCVGGGRVSEERRGGKRVSEAQVAIVLISRVFCLSFKW